jgi:hypothetical protein
MNKNGGKEKKWVSGYVGEKLEIRVFGGRRWVEMAGSGAVGGGGAWWVWILGSVWRRRTEKERVWGRNDLKIGPISAQLECVRTYICTYDHTRAWCMWCKWAQCSNLQGKFERKRA